MNETIFDSRFAICDLKTARRAVLRDWKSAGKSKLPFVDATVASLFNRKLQI